MITVIGTSTTTIGFGLCGIKDIKEVLRTDSSKDIIRMIIESQNKVIMIDEDIFEKVKDMLPKNDKIIINIPFRYREENEKFVNKKEEIDDLIKNSLGINIKM
jgi:vacuolar-type H+-ATPase subunit F/Vma7